MKLSPGHLAFSGDPVSLPQRQEGEPNKSNDGEAREKGNFSGGRFQYAVYCAKDQNAGQERKMWIPRPSIKQKSALQTEQQAEDIQNATDGP
jgi:hypothetical protein